MRLTALLLALLSPAAWAAEESAMNAADVSWMMVATTLVLFMTIPGIALFYAGMVRKKNVLSVVMQSFAICCSITIVWYVCGYSLAFTEGNFFIGGFDKVFLHGIGINTMQGSIPEMLFMMFQMTFAILTPALMCGAFAERMKFSALFLFMVLWSLFCYVPICHWVWGPDGWLAAAGALDYAGGTVVHINAGVAGLVACLMLGKRIGYGKEAMAPHNLILAMVGACFLWIGWFGFNGGSGLALFLFMVLWSLFCYVPICHWVWGPDGWLAAAGALDYAGGTVVHINAGVAGLVACLMLGKRIGYGKEAMAPHNLILAMVGACFLWIGWFGFNGGSGLAADGRAVMAIVVSQIAAAAAALIWMACEYVENKRFTVLGAISGAVAGLVAITPASGFVEPAPALFIGLCGGFICYFGATRLKHWLGYDDSLDAFGVHGVGGIVGAILTGVFASEAITGSAMKPVLEQVWVQTESVIATLIYASIVTYVLLKLVDVMIGIRVSAEEERMGLDLSLHGERVE